MGRVEKTEILLFLEAQPTANEFCHEQAHFVTIEIFIYFWQHLGLHAQRVLSYWLIWKMSNFTIEQTGSIFRWRTKFFHRNKMIANQQFSNKFSPN